MTSRVHTRFQAPAAADCKVARPASSLRVAVPTAHGINHLIGHVIGGQKHFQTIAGSPASTTETARMMVYRHPNCDYVDIVGRISADAAQSTWSITAQAGAGTAQVLALGTTSTAGILFSLRCPWASGDSGYQEITVAFVDVALRMLAVWEVPREELGTGDSRISLSDPTYPRTSLMADGYIAESSDAGPNGLVSGVNATWAYYYPQAVSWWTHTASAPVPGDSVFGGSGSASDLFDGFKFTHRCRQKRSSDTTQQIRTYIYGKFDIMEPFDYIELKVSSVQAGDSDTDTISGSFTGWHTMSTDITVAADEDDQLIFEARYVYDNPGGEHIPITGYISAISVIEIPGS